jgi:hypothetical protein
MSDGELPFDLAIVGAGAAGLMAAIAAAEAGSRVVLLEKTRRAGVKILMSGGTRCNITHACDNRGIVEAYGPPGRFLHSALAAFSVQDTVDFFHAEGVATKTEETGKIFPVSDKAVDVLQALLDRLRRARVEPCLEEPLLDLTHSNDLFCLHTPKRTLQARCVLLTTGGKSYPGSGTTGDGYAWLKKFGHTIIEPRPALVPITVGEPRLTELRGLTLPDVGVRILEGNKALAARRGSLLFAHFGLSGPVALDVSRVVSGHAAPQGLNVEINLLPAMRSEMLDEELRKEMSTEGKKLLAAVLANRVPRRMAEVAMSFAKIDLERRAAGLTKVERVDLVKNLLSMQVGVRGTLGFGRAEVTAGGVALNEIDSRSMQSKFVGGLFVAGELLDLDGPIGGYNFQAAWSTGWLAGIKAAAQAFSMGDRVAERL